MGDTLLVSIMVMPPMGDTYPVMLRENILYSIFLNVIISIEQTLINAYYALSVYNFRVVCSDLLKHQSWMKLPRFQQNVIL